MRLRIIHIGKIAADNACLLCNLIDIHINHCPTIILRHARIEPRPVRRIDHNKLLLKPLPNLADQLLAAEGVEIRDQEQTVCRYVIAHRLAGFLHILQRVSHIQKVSDPVQLQLLYRVLCPVKDKGIIDIQLLPVNIPFHFLLKEGPQDLLLFVVNKRYTAR